MVVSIIVSCCSAILSGVVLFFLQRYFKRKAKKDEQRDKEKREENILILKTIDAIGQLTYADSLAIRDGKTNGELKSAFEKYKETNAELYEYLLEVNSKK